MAQSKVSLNGGFRADVPNTRSPTIKLDQVVGFNVWALKAVLNGRGDELIDLAVSVSSRNICECELIVQK